MPEQWSVADVAAYLGVKPRTVTSYHALFCGQGGAAQGYIDAGFDVVGVDIADHGKRYPGTFVRDDAVEFLRANGRRFQRRADAPVHSLLNRMVRYYPLVR